MKVKSYLLASLVIFTLVFLVHLLRSLYSWPASIGEWDVPMWVSWLAVVVAGFMVIKGFLLIKKR